MRARHSMGRRSCCRRPLPVVASLGAALLLLCALRPAFENKALGSSWFGGVRKSPLQLLHDLDQVSGWNTRRHEPFNEHWERAHALCHPCLVRYDVVGKFETLADDAAFVLDLVGEPGLRFPAPPLRPEKDLTREQARRLFQDISPFYQRRLFNLYKMDFLLFNYSAPSYLRLQ
ncbi:carbohydrate sulfotransferase 13 [Mus caroli]|uniref:Carbohydrate sulfotransferase n=1 Tax=Mus caroli TaxID=10089 RepID=A0A6P7R439_MUSCR|nr:carbohydrate sulfotransferase 13 [Mus caroli]